MSTRLILKTCRVCLDEKGSISVFERNSDHIQYSKQIMDCVNITVEEDDGLPKMLCVQCVCDLEAAHQFVQRCSASDLALRSRLLAPLPASDERVTDDCSSPTVYGDYIKEETYSEPDVTKCQTKPKKKVKRRKAGPIQCVVCGYTAPSRSAMETHMRSHTGEKPYRCHECQLQFATKGGMKRHVTNNHLKRERRFTCETCGNSFFTKSDIITHMRIHTDEKPYTCGVCSMKFRQSASLIRHRRTHTGEKPYSCPVCSKCFANKDLVRKHQSVHSDEKKFSCSVCNKSMKTRTALKTHMILHSNEKCNVCSYCGLAFAMKGNLQTHMQRIHSERSGQCSVCMKTFPDLETHMFKHTGERPFACSACKQTYSTKRSLSRHIAFKHENAARFKCSIGECVRTFPTAPMLEFHLLKHHSNHTPFVCTHCARGFYRSSDLSRHVKISHMEVPLKLPVKSLIH